MMLQTFEIKFTSTFLNIRCTCMHVEICGQNHVCQDELRALIQIMSMRAIEVSLEEKFFDYPASIAHYNFN